MPSGAPLVGWGRCALPRPGLSQQWVAGESVGLTPEEVRDVGFHRPPKGERGYYEPDVDLFLGRAEAALRGRDSLTAREARQADFRESPAPRGGYHKPEVDDFVRRVVAALEALESGADALDPVDPGLASVPGLAPVYELGAGQGFGREWEPVPADAAPPDPDALVGVSFEDSASGELGYAKAEVDAFIDRVQDALRGDDPLTAREVYEVRFHPAPVGERGYDRAGVDAFLSLIAVTLRRSAQPTERLCPPPTTPPPTLPPPTLPPRALSRTPLHAVRPVATAIPAPFAELTADDVRTVAFRPPAPGDRGYNEAEVDALLDRVEATLRGEDTLGVDDVAAARFADAPPGARGYRTDDVDDFLDLVERRLAWSAGR